MKFEALIISYHMNDINTKVLKRLELVIYKVIYVV